MLVREIKAEERDKIEQIIKLEEEAFGKNGGVDEWVLKPFVRYGKVYVGLEGNEVIAVAELMRDWTGDTVYIYGFAVKQNAHGKGIGSSFLQNILDFLKKDEIKKITLTVDEKNSSAIALYEKYNFRKKEILKDEYGKNIDRLYMEWSL